MCVLLTNGIEAGFNARIDSLETIFNACTIAWGNYDSGIPVPLKYTNLVMPIWTYT